MSAFDPLRTLALRGYTHLMAINTVFELRKSAVANCSLAFIWIMVGACALGAPANHPPAPTSADEIGVVSLAADSTLTVKYADARLSPLIIIPSQSDARRLTVYHSYIEMVGGLRPGESKPIHAYIAMVEMQADRSLSVAWQGSSGDPVTEPYTEIIKPGSARYNGLVTNVGGLAPGQTKPLRKQ